MQQVSNHHNNLLAQWLCLCVFLCVCMDLQSVTSPRAATTCSVYWKSYRLLSTSFYLKVFCTGCVCFEIEVPYAVLRFVLVSFPCFRPSEPFLERWRRFACDVHAHGLSEQVEHGASWATILPTWRRWAVEDATMPNGLVEGPVYRQDIWLGTFGLTQTCVLFPFHIYGCWGYPKWKSEQRLNFVGSGRAHLPLFEKVWVQLFQKVQISKFKDIIEYAYMMSTTNKNA